MSVIDVSKPLTPIDVADLLDGAVRQGAANDEPEGARCIHLSDTLAKLLAAELRTHGGATLEVRQAPDLAKELTAWLDDNVSRCGHGTIYITCGPCMAGLLPR